MALNCVDQGWMNMEAGFDDPFDGLVKIQPPATGRLANDAENSGLWQTKGLGDSSAPLFIENQL